MPNGTSELLQQAGLLTSGSRRTGKQPSLCQRFQFGFLLFVAEYIPNSESMAVSSLGSRVARLKTYLGNRTTMACLRPVRMKGCGKSEMAASFAVRYS